MNPQDRLVFALDVPDGKEARRYVTMLEGVVGCFKVGLELFVREGPDVVKMIQDHSAANIFLDLKLHDIPATMRGAYGPLKNWVSSTSLSTLQRVKRSLRLLERCKGQDWKCWQ